MHIVLQDQSLYIVRFDKGEDLFLELPKFLAEAKITAAGFTGMGTCAGVELGFYNEFLKEYRKKPFMENMEIVSLIGNASMLGGKPVVHIHGSFSRNDFTLIAGHVFKLVVLATCEIYLSKMEGVAERKMNPAFNLNLLT